MIFTGSPGQTVRVQPDVLPSLIHPPTKSKALQPADRLCLLPLDDVGTGTVSMSDSADGVPDDQIHRRSQCILPQTDVPLYP
jgi:hypothetical protein